MKQVKQHIIGFLVIVLLVMSCSTEKNTFISRTYHNITAHYNVYFNGREAYRKGIKRVEDQHSDDFTQLLPVYILGNEETASTISGDMDKAIRKASKTIKYHSIKAKPKQKGGTLSKKDQEFMKKNEYNKWVDDSYLLMGKAYFMKTEFLPARQNFEYIIREFRKEDIKYDAMYWMARTNLATNNMKMTREWLDQIDAEKDFPEELQADVDVLKAAYHLKLREKDAAMPLLHKAIKGNKNKSERTRYQYLLAQLYKEKNDYRKAAQMFKKVVKSSATYEMSFNAKINMAECYGKLGGSYKDMKKLLTKMIRDDKNIDYLDQVYYALAEIEYENNKRDEAIKNYKLSSENSFSNNSQKAMSCMKLGNIYYKIPNYRLSQAYYDTCIMNLSNEHQRYDEIRNLSRNLTGLVIQMDVVEIQDSLQHIASLPEKERNALIDEQIQTVIEQEQREREMERERQQNSMLFDQRRGSNQINAPSGGGWYFYNPATLSFGQNEFKKKWGTRELEDHWRRSNKSVVQDDFYAEQDSVASDSNTVARVNDNKSRAYYMQDLPLNDSLMAVSNENIRDALFAMGEIYKRDFNDYDKSITAFKSLDERFPEHGYKLPAYYSLYELYKEKGKSNEANSYKQKVMNLFPESHYAKLLKNPNYMQELAEEQRQQRLEYETLYELYRKNKFQQAEMKANTFLQNHPESTYAPKVRFIQIITSALDVDQLVFKKNLAEFIQNFPEDALSNRAMQILGYLGETDMDALIADLDSRPTPEIESTENDTTVSDDVKAESLYSFDTNEMHLYIIATLEERADTKKLQFEVNSFNIFTFNMRTFKVNISLFSEDISLIHVKPFKNSKQSMNYMNLIKNNQTVFEVIDDIEHIQFVVSESNYEILKKEKDIDLYLKFYRNNY
ncbi:MAG: tetratricopeptide repeat protein [Bacteroidota bacterium]|nr:tetratricopeptide repeat protein [Bacteroidota bacterium]